jgi:hypothetical protein
LTAQGVDVSKVQVDGSTLLVYQDLTGGEPIKNELDKWAAYRLAAQEGLTAIRFEYQLNGKSFEDKYRIHPLARFPKRDAAEAEQVVADWIREVEAKTSATVSYQLADGRLSLDVEAPSGRAPEVAESFMMGGVAQAESGNLEVLTVIIRSQGQILFEGVSDYAIGAQSKVYQAPNLSFDW